MSLTLVTSSRVADHLPPGHPERVERSDVMQVIVDALSLMTRAFGPPDDGVTGQKGACLAHIGEIGRRVRARHRSGLLLAAILLLACSIADAAPRPRPRPRSLRMTASAYCDGGQTSSGTQAKSGIVAADPLVLPIGTVIRVVRAGVRAQTFTVTDTGSAVKGREIDIFIADCAKAKRFGRRRVQVTILEQP